MSNEISSRSHAICQLQILRNAKDKELVGSFILVDLAGAEKMNKGQHNSKIRRAEGADINKSLLSLKECIRQIDKNKSFIPFRGSKLTMLLRNSFQSQNRNNKIIMITCITPDTKNVENSLNSLRYSERLLEKVGLSY